jgi:toxin ParE1/3/4
MSNLQKTNQAEQDLIDIWLYTSQNWGDVQADTYLRKLEKCFEKISKGKAALKTLPNNIQFIKCEHHYVFLLMEQKAIVIAVLHEKMDLLVRLKDRLE